MAILILSEAAYMIEPNRKEEVQHDGEETWEQ
jgi:hypothetical protein